MKDIFILHELNSSNEERVRSAYKSIYNQYNKLIYFICAKYLNDNDDIEDIIVDSFVALFNDRKNISNIKNYLFTVSKNKAINLAKKKSNFELKNDEFFTNVTYQSNDQYSEIMEKIYQVLSKEDADIVIEHVVEGTSLSDIARRNNLSLNTLKSRYRRSIKKLNKYLGGKYE